MKWARRPIAAFFSPAPLLSAFVPPRARPRRRQRGDDELLAIGPPRAAPRPLAHRTPPPSKVPRSRTCGAGGSTMARSSTSSAR
eukprot:4632098-Prymnesium_polylepis.1